VWASAAEGSFPPNRPNANTKKIARYAFTAYDAL
jgi:hypothetical protein